MKRNSTRRKWMLWTKESTWTASLWPRQLPVCKAKLKMHSQHLKCHPLRRTEPSSGLRQVCEYFFWSTCLHHSLVETLCSLDASRRSAVQQCVCLGGLSIKHSHQGAPPVCAGSSMHIKQTPPTGVCTNTLCVVLQWIRQRMQDTVRRFHLHNTKGNVALCYNQICAYSF